MGTTGCGGFAVSAGTGSSRSLGPTVVTTAASTAGESLWSDPLDGPGSGAESPADGIETSRVSSGFGGTAGVTAPEGDSITGERVPARDARTSSRGLATGAAGRSTAPARSRSASPLSIDSMYSRSSGAEPGVRDSKLSSPTVRSSSACSDIETAPAETMRRSVGAPGRKSRVAANELRARVTSRAGVDTVPSRMPFARHGCRVQPRLPILPRR